MEPHLLVWLNLSNKITSVNLKILIVSVVIHDIHAKAIRGWAVHKICPHKIAKKFTPPPCQKNVRTGSTPLSVRTSEANRAEAPPLDKSKLRKINKISDNFNLFCITQ